MYTQWCDDKQRHVYGDVLCVTALKRNTENVGNTIRHRRIAGNSLRGEVIRIYRIVVRNCLKLRELACTKHV